MRIVRPVLQQVVARHVGLVADRDEARDPDPEAARVIENRQAERAALRRHRDVALGRIHRREGRVQAHARIRVQQAHAVWTDQPAAGRADPLDQRRLPRPSFRVALAEAGADHADRPDPLGDAVVDDRQDVHGRYDDDGEVHLAWNVCDVRERLQAGDRRGGRMHRHHRAGESRREQVVEDLRSDPPAFPVRADDRDDAGFEERLHRFGGGGLRDRSAALSSNRGVTSSERTTRSTPWSLAVVVANPESRNTSSIRRLPAST